MAVEVWANDGAATVTAGGTTAPAAGTSESWTLSGSTLPAVSSSATPPTQCYVADTATGAEPEKILITNISGSTATVTRGADGTSPVAHTTPFTIENVMTRASLQALQSGSCSQWLTVDDAGPYPVVREGAGGPQYRSAGWNIYAYYPPEGASFSLEVAESLFAQLAPGTLIRVWAYAPVPGSFSWASTITALQNLVAAGSQYGHRFIFTLSTWGDHNELYNQSGQPDESGNVKTVSWITSQQYLHSVYGANSLQDWVTAVVTAFQNEPAVSIYDIMNEPYDPTTSNVTAWATYCSTMSGWIKAIAPGALVYMGTANLGNFMGWSGVSSYATAIASMDLVNWHDYSTAGFSPLFLYDGIAKPQILDEHGAWAKGRYGSYSDSDLDTNGLPAMSWEAQARYYELYLETVFRSEQTFAALAWSLTEQDANGGPYGAYNGTGQYEPINQARARKVIHDYPAADHPYFTPETIGTYSAVLSWINSAQAFRYPDGSVVYSGANALQQDIHDLGPAGGFSGPSASGAGPVCRHWSVPIGSEFWPSLQFSGGQYMAGGTAWQDAGSATYFMVIYPAALPTGTGSATYGYLVSPTTNTTAAAVRVTSAGAVVLEQYSAATGGTVVATSTETLTAGAPALVMVQFVSGASYRIDVNTVPLSGSSATAYTATGLQFGAAHDGTNGFSGHLLEFIKYDLALSEAQISTVNAYLTRKYSGQSSSAVSGGGGTLTAYIAPKVFTLADGSSVAVNAALGNVARWPLAGSSHTLAAPSNPVDGMTLKIRIVYSGAYTPLWNAIWDFTPIGGAPAWTSATGKVDDVGFEYNADAGGGSGAWVCVGWVLGA